MTRSSVRTTRPSAQSSRTTAMPPSWFGKNHNTPDFQYSVAGPLRPMAVGNGLRLFLRLHGRRDRPVDAVSVPRSHADFPVGRQAGLQPHHRHGGRSHRLHEATQRRGARHAVLHLLRARRKPLAAQPEAGVGRQVQGQVRHGLECHARADLRQPEAAGRHPRECEAHRLAG